MRKETERERQMRVEIIRLREEVESERERASHRQIVGDWERERERERWKERERERERERKYKEGDVKGGRNSLKQHSQYCHEKLECLFSRESTKTKVEEIFLFTAKMLRNSAV